jgi:3-methyladenine DNA glycosylase AlkD
MLADTFALGRHADRVIVDWSHARHGFTKRCAFAMIARQAVSSDRSDASFVERFVLIRAAATDERNEVKKAVNWALRQLGKRSLALNRRAIKTAREIAKLDSKAARWIAKDALKELQSESIQKRLKTRKA